VVFPRTLAKTQPAKYASVECIHKKVRRGGWGWMRAKTST